MVRFTRDRLGLKRDVLDLAVVRGTNVPCLTPSVNLLLLKA